MDLELALSVIAATPTLEEASERLQEHGTTVSPEKLAVFARKYPDRLAAAQAQVAPRVEALAAGKMLDVTHLALAATEAAVVRTQERLADGVVSDPSKVARDLADVTAKMVDKRLALQGRPTQIVENRDVGEIVNALVAMKVATRVDAETTAEEIAMPIVPEKA